MGSSTVQGSFANAIALQEGYGASASNLPTRTFNPGDINNTDTSSSPGYATQDDGYAALDHQVGLMFSGGPGTIYSPNMTIAQVGSHFASDSNWAPGVAGRLGVSPNTTLAQLASGEVPSYAIARPYVDGASTGAEGSVDDIIASPAVAVSGSPISPAQIGAVMLALAPSTLVISAGLDETPWFSNPDIVQVDGTTSGVASPVTFQVYFTNPNKRVSDSHNIPITLKLNASLSRFDRSMRHISNHQPTRTGVLVTLWGMEPDVISGSGSTGVFANQFGLTDFLSLSDTSSADVQRLMTEGFPSTNSTYSPDAMRIAAKDAFMEFLMLFRQNGMVWFQGSTTAGTSTTSGNQLAPDAWSSTFGLSLTQMNARRNDVAARGGVVMMFRNSTYYGYFSTLSWSEDATKPFSWNFNFTFKVERTFKQMFTSSVANNLTQIVGGQQKIGSVLNQQSASATTGLSTTSSTVTEGV